MRRPRLLRRTRGYEHSLWTCPACGVVWAVIARDNSTPYPTTCPSCDPRDEVR